MLCIKIQFNDAFVLRLAICAFALICWVWLSGLAFGLEARLITEGFQALCANCLISTPWSFIVNFFSLIWEWMRLQDLFGTKHCAWIMIRDKLCVNAPGKLTQFCRTKLNWAATLVAEEILQLAAPLWALFVGIWARNYFLGTVAVWKVANLFLMKAIVALIADCVFGCGLILRLRELGAAFGQFPSFKKDINLVDPASSHTLVSKIKPCMSKYKQFYTAKLRMAHYISYSLLDSTLLLG